MSLGVTKEEAEKLLTEENLDKLSAELADHRLAIDSGYAAIDELVRLLMNTTGKGFDWAVYEMRDMLDPGVPEAIWGAFDRFYELPKAFRASLTAEQLADLPNETALNLVYTAWGDFWRVTVRQSEGIDPSYGPPAEFSYWANQLRKGASVGTKGLGEMGIAPVLLAAIAFAIKAIAIGAGVAVAALGLSALIEKWRQVKKMEIDAAMAARKQVIDAIEHITQIQLDEIDKMVANGTITPARGAEMKQAVLNKSAVSISKIPTELVLPKGGTQDLIDSALSAVKWIAIGTVAIVVGSKVLPQRKGS
jgi:hypothetical protein